MRGRVGVPRNCALGCFNRRRDRIRSGRTLTGGLPLAFFLVFAALLLLFGACHGPAIVLLVLPLVFVNVMLKLLLLNGSFSFFTVLNLLKLVNVGVGGTVMLMSRVSVRGRSKLSPHGTIVGTAVDHVIPMTVTSNAAVLNVLPLLFSTVFNKVTTAVVNKLLMTSTLALFILPMTCYTVREVGKWEGRLGVWGCVVGGGLVLLFTLKLYTRIRTRIPRLDHRACHRHIRTCDRILGRRRLGSVTDASTQGVTFAKFLPGISVSTRKALGLGRVSS